MSTYREPLLTKTKIVATVGPASRTPEQLRPLIAAGVDVVRLNFAHGTHAEKAEIVADVRRIARELGRNVAILGDLSGPKIRLGQLPEEGRWMEAGAIHAFVRDGVPLGEHDLTTSYPGLVDDLQVGDGVRLADGAVSLRVREKTADRAICSVEQPGRVLSRQGVNLPGAKLRIASVTEQDEADLTWALEQRLDFIGLSFVRSAADLKHLRSLIEARRQDESIPGEEATAHRPWIVAKIEKPEAIDDLPAILAETDVVMVARGDLGVEVDIVRVPVLQKRIIAECNQARVPVITATQMLESMIQNELPTRAEVTDVANAVLDGADAVMLSGETAKGRHPATVVTTMSRIAREAETLLATRSELPLGLTTRSTATELTVAITRAAIQTAERIQAKLLVLSTRSGKTAAALSELRSRVPILALTDTAQTASLLALTWGVEAVVTNLAGMSSQQTARFAQTWSAERGLLKAGDRFVLIGTTDWKQEGKDLLLVQVAK